MTRRGLAAALASFLAACSPLSAFNKLAPRDPANRGPLDVAYGPDPRHRLDLYAPAQRTAQPAPLLVFFYGGAWNSGRRQDYAWVGQALAAQGYVVAVADHRLVPSVRYPAFIEDAAHAVAKARELAPEHGGDPDRIVLSGHSSGAYIASMLAFAPTWLAAVGVDRSLVKAFAGLSGPYDFYPFDVSASIEAFGQAPDPRMTQPVNLDLHGAPPTFLGHGDKDKTVRLYNSQSLARALTAVGDTVELKTYAGLDHKDAVLALSRPFRGKAPVLDDLVSFLHAHGV